MQEIGRAVRSCQEILKATILQHSNRGVTAKMEKILSHFVGITGSSSLWQKGLENVTVAEVIMTKGEEHTGSWLWCQSADPVVDAVKHVSFCCNNLSNKVA